MLTGDGEVTTSHDREQAKGLIAERVDGRNVKGRLSPLKQGDEVVMIPGHGDRGL